MSLKTVVDDIRDEAQQRAADIREEAEADAEQIREERAAAVEREVEAEREQRISSAKLEAKQERLAARRDVLEDVRADVEAAVAAIDGETREELTRTLIEAAGEEFKDDDAVAVYCRPADAELVDSILESEEGFSRAGEYDCLGGVVVESESSRVRVNNTFDSILDAVWEDNLREVSERLFEEQ